MKRVSDKDMVEIRSVISSLKLNMFKGYAVECPNCHKKGYFGSVIMYECESSHWYILCGWCGSNSPIKEVDK